jgi:hypothetical protein
MEANRVVCSFIWYASSNALTQQIQSIPSQSGSLVGACLDQPNTPCLSGFVLWMLLCRPCFIFILLCTTSSHFGPHHCSLCLHVLWPCYTLSLVFVGTVGKSTPSRTTAVVGYNLKIRTMAHWVIRAGDGSAVATS